MKRALAALILAFILCGCSDASQKSLPIVSAYKAILGEIVAESDFTGLLVAYEPITVTSKQPGKIKSLNIEAGQRVVVGDVLIVFDFKELELDLKDARAAVKAVEEQVAIAEANLNAANVAIQAVQTTIEITCRQTQVELTAAIDAYNMTLAVIADQEKSARLNVRKAQETVASADASILEAQVAEVTAREGVKRANDALTITLEQNQIAIAQADQSLQMAQDTFDRVSALYEAQVASGMELQNAQLALDSAQRSQKLAASQADSAALTAHYQVSQAENSVAQAENAVSQAKSTLSAANTALEMTNAALEQTTGSGAKSQIAAAQAKVNAAQLAYDQARSEASNVSLNEAKAAAATAQAQYNAASGSVLNQAIAGVERLETQMANATITAPSSGTITSVNVRLGENVAADSQLATIADVSELRLSGFIPTPIAERVVIGTSVDVYVGSQASSGVVAAVVLSDVSSAIEIVVLNANGTLLPGVSCRAVVSASKDAALTVPSVAIANDGGKAFVYVIKGGIVSLRLVEIGLEVNGYVEIITGLSEGEQVATSNLSALSDGQQVETSAN